MALAAGLTLALGLLGGAGPARADDATDARQLVERARHALENFYADSNMEGFRALMRERARAILIFPQIVRVGFILGGSGGSGVMLARSPEGGWLGPAFYTLGQGSIGLQAGAEASEVVILATSEKGLTSLLSTSMKFGADASVAVGPVGMGAAGASAGLSADLVAYSRGKGLYLGFSVDGAVVDVRETLNGAYYGQALSPLEILLRGQASSPHAQPLIETLTRISRGQ